MRRVIAALALFFACAATQAPGPNVTIVKAGPIGEVAKMAEANEIRVVFSEPMIVIGKIPKDLNPPWFHVSPFSWLKAPAGARGQKLCRVTGPAHDQARRSRGALDITVCSS